MPNPESPAILRENLQYLNQEIKILQKALKRVQERRWIGGIQIIDDQFVYDPLKNLNEKNLVMGFASAKVSLALS